MTRKQEEGFVLVTSLVILLILTILSVGLYFRSVVNQQASVSTRDATKAYYYAETALNYVSWSLHSGQNNDANLDPANPDADAGTGDRTELQVDTANPTAQVNYIDSRPIASRRIVYNPANNPNPYDPSTAATPVFQDVSANLPPNYLVLTIAADGVITKTLSTTVPATHNGAVIWLTPSDQTTLADSTGGSTYDIAAYAIGYVNGKPLRILRAIIGDAGMGPPVGLGSVTNGFQ